MEHFEYNTRARRLRRYLGIALGRPLVGPQVVSLETTHHCNLRCSFCESHGSLLPAPITATREYVGGRRTMSVDRIRRLAGEMAEVGVDLVELSGKGDPIAHPNLTEIVKALRDAGLGVAVVTNGTLAKPDLAPTLVERGLDRLSVSLNGGSRESYLNSNHRDLWDKALRFLQAVLEERRKVGSATPWVRITHVVTKENVQDFAGMIQICADLGVDEVCFYVMGELRQTVHLQLDPAEIAGVRAAIPEGCRLLDQAKVVHNLPVFGEELTMRAVHSQPQANPLQRGIPCYEGWMFCVIQPDGVVLPCCYCEDEHLGNVEEQSFAEIWHGALYKAFRRRSLDMPKTGRAICKECFTTCNRGVENRRIYHKLHPLTPKPMKEDAAAASIASR